MRPRAHLSIIFSQEYACTSEPHHNPPSGGIVGLHSPAHSAFGSKREAKSLEARQGLDNQQIRCGLLQEAFPQWLTPFQGASAGQSCLIFELRTLRQKMLSKNVSVLWESNLDIILKTSSAILISSTRREKSHCSFMDASGTSTGAALAAACRQAINAIGSRNFLEMLSASVWFENYYRRMAGKCSLFGNARPNQFQSFERPWERF